MNVPTLPGFWSILYALVLLGAGWVLGSWLAGVARLALERGRLDPAVRHLLVSLVRPLVIVVAVIAALNLVGIDLTVLVAVLGAATLAIGLALRDSLANVAAGALLLTLRPFHGGDFVEVSGQSGTVMSLGLFTTGLKNSQGVLITVPNRLVIAQAIKNFTRNGLRRADITFRVAPDTDLGAAKQAILAVLEADERVLDEPGPMVRVEAIDAWGVDLLVAGWFTADDFGAGKSDVTAALREALESSGVELSTRTPAVFAQQG